MLKSANKNHTSRCQPFVSSRMTYIHSSRFDILIVQMICALAHAQINYTQLGAITPEPNLLGLNGRTRRISGTTFMPHLSYTCFMKFWAPFLTFPLGARLSPNGKNCNPRRISMAIESSCPPNGAVFCQRDQDSFRLSIVQFLREGSKLKLLRGLFHSRVFAARHVHIPGLYIPGLQILVIAFEGRPHDVPHSQEFCWLLLVKVSTFWTLFM